MKKTILTVILLFGFVFTLFGQENEEKERKYSFQIKPLSYVDMLFTTGVEINSEFYSYTRYIFEFEFQYAINNRFNLSLSPFFGTTSVPYFEWDKNGNEYLDEYRKDIAYGISAGLLYRPWGNGLIGMYIGLYPILGMLHVKFKEINDTLFSIGIMLESGYQWVFKNGFTLALGGGFGFSGFIPFSDTKGEYKRAHFLNYPFDLSIRISLGYSF